MSEGDLPSPFLFTPTGLSGFFECNRKTWLEIQVHEGRLSRPGQNEIERQLLERRGHEHEDRVLEGFRAAGLKTVTIARTPRGSAGWVDAAEQTIAAMRDGHDVIHQGLLRHGNWVGYPDFLCKSPGPSAFGAHHYEVMDAKLGRVPTARAVVQLCAYSDSLGALQGRLPEFFSIITGGPDASPVKLRLDDYFAYYRRASAAFESFIADGGRGEPYPEPVQHCDVCQWWMTCATRRRNDDHLSLVAGITRRQRERLHESSITTRTGLAKMPLNTAVAGLDAQSIRTIREQARIQVEGPLYELLPDMRKGEGLERLPPPSPGDLFFDLEGDSFAYGQGLEYLFGLFELGKPIFDFPSTRLGGGPQYLKFWATNPAEEKVAFEKLMRRIADGRMAFPDMHIFHYGHRESVALKTLSCRHGTCEAQVDDLLRGHVMVDLLGVVRQTLRASVEHYTLKDIEMLYRFERATSPRDAAWAMQMFGWWLEVGEDDPNLDAYRDTIERYNEEDCRSAWKLRDWLEDRRSEVQAVTGQELARPSVPDEEKGESDSIPEALRLVKLLVANEPLDSPKRLLAALLFWHWRERKMGYWEHYGAKEVVRSERVANRLVLSGLTYVGTFGTIRQSDIHRYAFDADQDHIIRRIPGALDPDTNSEQKIHEIGPDYIDILRGKNRKATHPTALIPKKPLGTKDQERRLVALADSIVRLGLDSKADLAASRALLCRTPPALGQDPGESLIRPDETVSEGMARLVLQLNGHVLAVQGPPGSGKTYRGAEAIIALIGAGKKVGVTANSHRVIASLLAKVVDLAGQAGTRIRAHHIDDADETPEGPIGKGKDYPAILDKIRNRELDLVGGTAFAWSRADFDEAVDVLVVDEAGQMSLANALAVSGAANSLILLGDPAQLEQPTRGVHPDGAEVSALQHWLGDHRTMPPAMGVFLPETRRLHPAICEFTSRAFYEGRLRPRDGLASQVIRGPEPFNGAGLRFLPVRHTGNTNRADEEVEAIRDLVGSLLSSRPRFTNAEQEEADLKAEHILVITPFNAQVTALRSRLPPQIKTGTVDKFQGAEAPIVIYSMASSTAADAPRGIEFLYDLNRLNVATSRATTLVVVVASPTLMEAGCRTPRQMQLINALCLFEAKATRHDPTSASI